MPDEIVKFDPSTLADRLRSRIRDSIADLIPEEQWKAMLTKEVDAFFNSTTVHDRWNDPKTVPSVFHEIVDRILRERAAQLVREWLDSPTMLPVWTNGVSVASAAVKTMAAENMPAMVEGLLAGALQGWLMQLRGQIPR